MNVCGSLFFFLATLCKQTAHMTDLIASSLASYYMTNQEVFRVALHPANTSFVKSTAENTLGRRIADDDFQQISIEVLQKWFAVPNHEGATLRETLSRLNRAWIDTFVQRHRANASLAQNYAKAVQQSFLGRPSELPMPTLDTRKGTRILVLDQGFGRQAIRGKDESQKIYDMYA